jgi:hypothetical protein
MSRQKLQSRESGVFRLKYYANKALSGVSVLIGRIKIGNFLNSLNVRLLQIIAKFDNVKFFK